MRTLTRKPLDWFQTRPQVRSEFDDNLDRQLGESLKAHGQIQPVVARPDGQLLAGERRLRGARWAGLAELDVVITDEELPPAEITLLQLTENVHRAGLSDQEKVRACETLLALEPGLDQKGLASRLKVDAATISKWLCVREGRAIPAVREAFFAKQIGLAAAYPISQAPATHQPELLARALAGATRDELAGAVKRRRCESSPGPKLGHIRCPLPTGVTINFAGTALSLDTVIDALAEAQRAAKKARDEGLDARTWQAIMTQKSQSQGTALDPEECCRTGMSAGAPVGRSPGGDVGV